MKEDTKEIVTLEGPTLADGMTELADLHLALVGGGCGEVVLV